MSRFFRWLGRLIGDFWRFLQRPIIWRLFLILLALGLLDGAVYLFCETQWQRALGFAGAWHVRFLTQVQLFSAVAFLALGLAAWPLRLFASLPPGELHLPPRYEWLERRLQSLSRYDARWLQVSVLVLAFVAARDAALHWPQWLLLQQGETWGQLLTPWQADAGLWVFRLPGLHLVLNAAQRAVDIALLAALPPALGRGAAQFITGGPLLPRRLLRCLAVLGAFWFACHAARLCLAPFDLALRPAGITFLDWHARRPVLWLGAALNLLVAFLFFAAPFWRFRAGLALRLGAIAVLAPPLLLYVVPRLMALGAWDESRREEPFRSAHRAALQTAWNLEEVAIENHNLTPDAKAARLGAQEWRAQNLAQLPLWDGARLRRVAPCKGQPLQADRVLAAGKMQLVGAGVCDDAPGAVLMDAASGARLAANVKPNPRILYNVKPNRYLLVGRYYLEEEGEIALDGLVTRLLWAWHLRAPHILAAAGNDLSFRPAIVERARALAPFLVPGGSPLPVVYQGRVVWMLDLLAVSDAFPAGIRHTVGGRTFNGARDSVKMVMDSATGRTQFFAARRDGDPLLTAWQKALPGLSQPLQAMPVELQSHRRYPVELFRIQAALLGRTLQAKNWQLAQQRSVTGLYQMQMPFFSLDESGFTMHEVLSQGDAGENIAALLSAHSDGTYYGRLTLRRFDVAAAPLHANSTGPGAFGFRIENALPVAEDGGVAAWKRGLVRTLWRGNRLWLWQAVFREEKGFPPRLAAVIFGDAAWRDGPLGVGNNPRAALDDWLRALRTEKSALDVENFAARVQAVLEPQKVKNDAQVAQIIAEVARLHDAARVADKSDKMAAARLRERERILLDKLRRLTTKATDVEIELKTDQPKARRELNAS